MAALHSLVGEIISEFPIFQGIPTFIFIILPERIDALADIVNKVQINQKKVFRFFLFFFK